MFPLILIRKYEKVKNVDEKVKKLYGTRNVQELRKRKIFSEKNVNITKSTYYGIRHLVNINLG